jgi:hypothetical protein
MKEINSLELITANVLAILLSTLLVGNTSEESGVIFAGLYATSTTAFSTICPSLTTA